MTVPQISALPTPPSRSDAANFAARADAFLGALPTFRSEANAVATAANDSATQASASAATAMTAPGTQGNSTTAMDIATGGVGPFYIETGKNFVPTMWVNIGHKADPTKWMAGPISSYNSSTGAMVVQVQRIAGVGNFNDWSITQCAPMTSDGTPRNLATGSTIADAAGTPRDIGTLDLPSIPVAAAHALALSDRGMSLDIASGGSISIPANATVPLPIGAIIAVQNLTTSNKTITAASGVTLHLGGSNSPGTRTIAAYGTVTLRQVALNVWVANGSGLT